VRHEEALAKFKSEIERRNLSPKTWRGYCYATRAFLRWFGRPVLSATRDDLRAYLASIAERGARPASLAHHAVSLRAFYRALNVEPSPAAEFGFRITSTPQLVLTRSQVGKLLAASSKVSTTMAEPEPIREAIALCNRAVLEVLYGAGLRVSELAAVRVVDVSLADGTILVRPAKRGEPRTLPLPKASLPHLLRYLAARSVLLRPWAKDEGFLFLGRTGKPVTPYSVQQVVSKLAKRIGLRAHPHAFRRSVATHLVKDGVSVAVVQRLLGHRSLEATAIYLGTDQEDLRRAVSVLEHK
jgi:integrase/recombinase XerC